MSSGDEHQGPKGAAANGSRILQRHGCRTHPTGLPQVRLDFFLPQVRLDLLQYFYQSTFRLATQISRSITKNRDAFDAMSATDKVVQVLGDELFCSYLASSADEGCDGG